MSRYADQFEDDSYSGEDEYDDASDPEDFDEDDLESLTPQELAALERLARAEARRDAALFDRAPVSGGAGGRGQYAQASRDGPEEYYEDEDLAEQSDGDDLDEGEDD